MHISTPSGSPGTYFLDDFDVLMGPATLPSMDARHTSGISSLNKGQSNLRAGRGYLFKSGDRARTVPAHRKIDAPIHRTLRLKQIKSIIPKEIGVVKDIREHRIQQPINLFDLFVRRDCVCDFSSWLPPTSARKPHEKNWGRIGGKVPSQRPKQKNKERRIKWPAL
jgi:hypothetical protein